MSKQFRPTLLAYEKITEPCTVTFTDPAQAWYVFFRVAAWDGPHDSPWALAALHWPMLCRWARDHAAARRALGVLWDTYSDLAWLTDAEVRPFSTPKLGRFGGPFQAAARRPWARIESTHCRGTYTLDVYPTRRKLTISAVDPYRCQELLQYMEYISTEPLPREKVEKPQPVDVAWEAYYAAVRTFDAWQTADKLRKLRSWAAETHCVGEPVKPLGDNEFEGYIQKAKAFQQARIAFVDAVLYLSLAISE